MEKEIAAIIPACNEAGSIEKNILALEDFLRHNYSSYEIIVSEDGSTDGTNEIVRKLSSKNAAIIHLHSDKRLGKGKAISNAILSSHSKSIFLTDADFPADMRCITQMTGLLDRYDMVLGTRLKKGGKAKRPFMRSFLSHSYNSLVRLAFRTGISDHQCGVKAFRRDALAELIPQVESRGFFWDSELIVMARKRDYRIAEVPLTWKDRKRGKSKVSVLKESYRMGKDTAKLWYRINFRKA